MFSESGECGNCVVIKALYSRTGLDLLARWNSADSSDAFEGYLTTDGIVSVGLQSGAAMSYRRQSFAAVVFCS